MFLFFLFFLFPVDAFAQDHLRIVSLAPNLTEMVYALDLGPDLVGDTKQCNYPEQAKKVEKIGDYNHPSLEKILQLKPDVVLATEGNSRVTVDLLKQLHIKVIETNPHNMRELIDSIRKIGLELNSEKKGNQIAARIQSQINVMENHPVQNQTFLFVIQLDPIYSANDQTWIGSLFQTKGLKNVIGQSKIKYPVVSQEYLLLHKPDVIFATEFDPRLKQLGNRVVLLPKDIFFRPGPRVWDALRFLEKI